MYIPEIKNVFKNDQFSALHGTDQQIPLAAAPIPNGNVRLFGSSGGSADGAGTGGDANSKLNALPWGSLLPHSMEQTLPGYPMPVPSWATTRATSTGSGAGAGAGSAPTDGEWRIVNGTRYKFFVYSAFYDRRSGGRLIRVIGATKTRGPEKVWCRLWYAPTAANATVTSTSVVARVKVIRENWNLKYSACFVLCPVGAALASLHDREERLPFAISVVSKLRAPPGNVLRLHHGDPADGRLSTAANRSGGVGVGSGGNAATASSTVIPNSIGVCIKPLHFDYDSVSRLFYNLNIN